MCVSYIYFCTYCERDVIKWRPTFAQLACSLSSSIMCSILPKYSTKYCLNKISCLMVLNDFSVYLANHFKGAWHVEMWINKDRRQRNKQKRMNNRNLVGFCTSVHYSKVDTFQNIFLQHLQLQAFCGMSLQTWNIQPLGFLSIPPKKKQKKLVQFLPAGWPYWCTEIFKYLRFSIRLKSVLWLGYSNIFKYPPPSQSNSVWQYAYGHCPAGRWASVPVIWRI